MPVDLTEYTKLIREVLKPGGYVAAVASPERTRIGYSEHLPATIDRLQRTVPSPLTVAKVLWLPSKAMATILSRQAYETWRSTKLKEAEPSVASVAVPVAAVRIYPNAIMVEHEELVRQWNGNPKRTTAK